MPNKQTLVLKDGTEQSVEDNGAGLRKTVNPSRTGLNIVMRHPKCKTLTRYLVDESVKMLQSGGALSLTIETQCDECGEPLSVSLQEVTQGS